MKGVVKKTEFGWVPFSQDAQKVYDKMDIGELAMVECTRNRNYENHKRFFELRDQTFEIQDEFECEEQWRKQLLGS